MTCVDAYIQIYHKQPEGVSFCPYRVAPLGAHTDHQNGKVNGFAIDKGIQQQRERYTVALHFAVYALIVRHLERCFPRRTGKEPFCQLTV